MNSNLFHNILNVVIALAAIASLPEVMNLMPPEIALKVVGIAAGVKMGVNVVRDGITGLTKPQPPVKK